MKKEFRSAIRNRIYYRNYDVCKGCGSAWHNPAHKTFCSRECYWKAKKGTKVVQNFSLEEKAIRQIRMLGNKNPMWRGGDSDSERRNSAYRKWRIDVFKRDGFKCTECGYYNGCGERRKDLNAHHLVKWIDSIELRCAIENGKTLCVPCHIKYHTNRVA